MDGTQRLPHEQHEEVRSRCGSRRGRRFVHLLAPGLYAYWHGVRDVRVEMIDIRQVRFEHEDLKSRFPVDCCSRLKRLD